MEQECGDREKEERAVAVEEAEVRNEAGETAEEEALLPKRNRATADVRADDVRRSSGNTIRESSEEGRRRKRPYSSLPQFLTLAGRVSVIT